ncbi:TPA: ribbon-helix-helix protein, CopG family [Clostridioides difficile]|nr:ribbon-helix-helix protein, CopG family [Clostridioides difficile]
MKESFNLSIDKDLKKYIKHIAINEGITVSELIEDYIKAIKATNGETLKAIRGINSTNKLKKPNKRL